MDYLGCEFHMNKERTTGWLGQPSIIKSLEKKVWRQEEDEGTEGDGHSTPTQTKLGLDINMIGAKKETL